MHTNEWKKLKTKRSPRTTCYIWIPHKLQQFKKVEHLACKSRDQAENPLGKILIPINISLANNNAKGNIITENSSTLEFKLQTPRLHMYMLLILFYLTISQNCSTRKKNESQARNDKKKKEEPYIWAGQNKFKKKIVIFLH